MNRKNKIKCNIQKLIQIYMEIEDYKFLHGCYDKIYFLNPSDSHPGTKFIDTSRTTAF